MNFTMIFAALQKQQDEVQAQKMGAYMRHQFAFLGVSAPLRRVISKPFLQEGKKAAATDWDFVHQCWENPYREMQYVALDYLKLRQQYLSPADIPLLKQLILTKSWWDSIDCLDRIVGNIALRYPELNALLLAWSGDDNQWLRRIAIDHQLLRKEQTHTELLAQILVNNLEQKAFFINKAIGWALREYSKTNPEWVRTFIAQHQSRMAKLSIREASKYLESLD